MQQVLAEHLIFCRLFVPGESFCCPVCGVVSGKWPDLSSHLWKEHDIDCDMYQAGLSDLALSKQADFLFNIG